MSRARDELSRGGGNSTNSLAEKKKTGEGGSQRLTKEGAKALEDTKEQSSHSPSALLFKVVLVDSHPRLPSPTSPTETTTMKVGFIILAGVACVAALPLEPSPASSELSPPSPAAPPHSLSPGQSPNPLAKRV